VVLYHVWFGRVSGGVDIFLTLSGYFFVGSLLRTAESGARLDPVPVVRRVTRRLAPALVVVLAAVAVFTVAYHPATAWYETAKQTTASMLFLQNWHLANTASDYLAADPSVSPLQHLWSISVQGQFYLAALVVVFGLAWLLRTRGLSVRGPLAVLLSVLAVASLTYAATSDLPQTWLYYDTGARMWELLAGGILACVTPWLRIPRPARIVLSVAGLAIVLACGMVLEGRSQFPGPWALVPVGAAIALIVAGSAETDDSGNPFTRALASRPLLRLGTIAYALYLWHWPLLIGYLVITGRTDAGLTGGLVVIALSLVLAELTTRLIETPIRRPSGTGRARTALIAAASTLAVLVAAGSVTWAAFIDRDTEQWAQQPDLDPQIYPGAAALFAGADAPHVREEPSRFVAHADLPATTTDGCMSQPGQTDPLTCTYGDPDANRSVALIGGSHAEHWLPALDTLGREHGFRVDTYVKVGCPAVLPPTPDAEVGECEEWTFGVVDALAEAQPDIVFSTSTRPAPDEPGDYTPDTYVALWQELADRDLNIVAVRDTPWLESNGIQYRAADCLAQRGGNSDSCGIDRAEVLSEVDPAQAAIADLSNVQLLDLSDDVCRADRCRVVEGNVLIYRDSNHLTASYVRTLTPELDRLLGPATGWW